MKRISITNHKGGCAKTTTCISLAHGLSRAGKRVLVVDVDPQGNAGDSFGVKHPKTLYHLLTQQSSVEECIAHARENLDIIISNKTLVVAEQNISGEMGRERYLNRSLENLNNNYDYLFFDCAPSWRLLNQNALLASQALIMPINMEFFALTGAKEILTEIKKIKELLKHKLTVDLIVPTFYDVRNSKSSRILEQLIDFFGAEKVAEPIRTNVKISESVYYKQTIFEYAPWSHGAEDYEKLTKRVMQL